MDRCIGLDAHGSSCTLGVVGPSGQQLGSHVVETNARALIEWLRGIQKERHACDALEPVKRPGQEIVVRSVYGQELLTGLDRP